MRPWTKCIIIGTMAGALNGLFGAGGGMILVPLLNGWVKLEQKQSLATSVAIIWPISIASYSLFCINGGNVWNDALPYLCGGVIGGLIAGHIFRSASAKWLHRIFSLLLFYGGIKAVLFP